MRCAPAPRAARLFVLSWGSSTAAGSPEPKERAPSAPGPGRHSQTILSAGGTWFLLASLTTPTPTREKTGLLVAPSELGFQGQGTPSHMCGSVVAVSLAAGVYVCSQSPALLWMVGLRADRQASTLRMSPF